MKIGEITLPAGACVLRLQINKAGKGLAIQKINVGQSKQYVEEP